MMRRAWTWALVVLSLACSAFLFARTSRCRSATTPAHDLHLRGMWVAFGVSASFIVYFLCACAARSRAHERELDAARAARQRQERLASLATLAAGAAHEL